MPEANQAQPANVAEPQEGAASTTTNAQTAAATQAVDDVQSLPAWAQKLIKDANREAAASRKARQETEAAAKQAEEAKLAENSEWQKLAEQRKTELDALTTTAARYTALSTEITAALESEIKGWPEEIKALRPADADAATLLVWVKGARPLAAKLAGTPAPVAGQGQTPKPAAQGAVANAQRQQDAVKQVRAKF